MSLRKEPLHRWGQGVGKAQTLVEHPRANKNKALLLPLGWGAEGRKGLPEPGESPECSTKLASYKTCDLWSRDLLTTWWCYKKVHEGINTQLHLLSSLPLISCGGSAIAVAPCLHEAEYWRAADQEEIWKTTNKGVYLEVQLLGCWVCISSNLLKKDKLFSKVIVFKVRVHVVPLPLQNLISSDTFIFMNLLEM